MKYQVKIRKVFNIHKPVKAFASVTIEDKIAIHGIWVIETPEKGKFIAMPYNTIKDKDGNEIRRDIAHPISADARKELENAGIEAYETALKEAKE